MASEVDWKNMGGSGSGKSKTRFLKFEAGKPKKFRPVGRVVEFYKFFHKGPNGSRSVVVDPDIKDKAAALLSAKAGVEIQPKQRFAINVIDRDDGQIKILEGGPTIFNAFAMWSQNSDGASPGAKTAFDWAIQYTGDGLNRKYATTPIKPSTLTDAEVALVKKTDGTGMYALMEQFVGCPLDEVVERMFGDRSSSKSSDGPEPEVEVAAAASSGGSDDF